ncbi:MAG TPA: hypothetical protein VMT61_14310 [Candidatus Binataceae bacterium]|nr:hypothetical protein [Candidatus Binataceae bacterium]
MKIAVKPKTEATEQLNIRIPASLRQSVDRVRALADEVGVDYHATLVAMVAQFNTELEAELLRIKNKDRGASNSASTSVPTPTDESISLEGHSNGKKINHG